LLDLALAHWRLADVVIERGLAGERRRRARPLDLEGPHGLDGVPFPRPRTTEEGLAPPHLGTGDVLRARPLDFAGNGAGGPTPEGARMQHAGLLDVGAVVLLGKDLRGHVLALDALADDLVILEVFRLGLARCIERVAVLLVPVELDVEVLAADQL